MKQTIVLMGFSGVGKSSLLGELAKHANPEHYPNAYDLDQVLKEIYFPDQSISEFVTQNSWERFRVLEGQTFCEFFQDQGQLWALGGGSIESADVQYTLQNSNALKIWITDSLDHCITRGMSEIEDRPLFRKSREELLSLYLKREPMYQSLSNFSLNAPHEVTGLTEIAQAILLQTKDGGL